MIELNINNLLNYFLPRFYNYSNEHIANITYQLHILSRSVTYLSYNLDYQLINEIKSYFDAVSRETISI